MLDLSQPLVMGILNVTPDSFYALSRKESDTSILHRTEEILSEGGDIIDIGGCSTRPGSAPVSEDEELERVRRGLSLVRRVAPDAVLSVDTFRSSVARMSCEEFGVSMVNDISGGSGDAQMFDTVSSLGVPYVLTYNRGADDMKSADVVGDMMLFFSGRIQQLRDRGQKDIILDPGFGFAKDLDENYRIVSNLSVLDEFGLPLLIGVSRKRMVYNLLDCSIEDSLNGTTALHMACLLRGNCHLLRVHDVKACREVVAIYNQLKKSE